MTLLMRDQENMEKGMEKGKIEGRAEGIRKIRYGFYGKSGTGQRDLESGKMRCGVQKALYPIFTPFFYLIL